MDLNIQLNDSGEDKKKAARVKEAERKKALKAYQPTDEEVWFTGYETHTGKRKNGIYQNKNSEADKKKLDMVYDAIQKGELSKGVDDMKKFTKAHALRLYQNLMVKRRKAILDGMVKKTPDNYVLAMDTLTLGNHVRSP